MSQAEKIFNKYAEQYLQKYADVDMYSGSLDFFLKALKPNSNVLEVACGPGNLTGYLISKKSDLDILGLDIAENMIELAKKNQSAAEFMRMDCREIYKLNRKFDAVVAGFYLPYLSKDEAQSFIGYSSNLLNDNGILYASLIEGNYDNSGFIGSSNDDNERLFTYYHERDYLLDFLNSFGFGLLFSENIENENNRENIKDLILIARKLKA